MSSYPVVRGSPWIIPVAVIDANGDAIDISGWTIVGVLKAHDADATFTTTVQEVAFEEGAFNFVIEADAPTQSALSEGQLSLLVMTFTIDGIYIDKRSIWIDLLVAENYAVESADGNETLVI